MALENIIPETRVLAVASHVVHGYVGNKMATFVMQSLGCDVSAINTVHYSNHTAYKQVKGTKSTAQEIADLYEGLQQSNLNHFDLMLTGYMPSAEAVEQVGKIARDLRYNAVTKPGSFFWVLDPVMGDNGKLYIPEDEVPQYKSLLREADLILPNQFEAELLSDTTITDLNSLATAIQALHKSYQVPHIIITSLRLTRDNQTVSSRAPSKPASANASGVQTPSEPREGNSTKSNLASSPGNPREWPAEEIETLTIIGSTSTSDHKPRLFRIDLPKLPLFFSGTGDMFAALVIPRLIEAVHQSSTPDLSSRSSWKSPDDVSAEDLPLARACQKVLASMQAILGATSENCKAEMEEYDAQVEKEGCGQGEEAEEERQKKRHLALMNASEVKVVRFIKAIHDPPELERFRPRSLEEDVGKVDERLADQSPDELGVLPLALGKGAGGAIQVVGTKVNDISEEPEKMQSA